MENDELYRKIISLPKRDMDLLTLIAFEGYSQREVAEIRGIAPAAICKKIAKLKTSVWGLILPVFVAYQVKGSF